MIKPDFLFTLTEAEKIAIFGHIDAIEAILHFRVNLTAKREKKNARWEPKIMAK